MSIKTIFVPLTDARDAVRTLETAFLLAAEFDAHVSALHPRLDPTASVVEVAGESISPALIEQVVSDAEKRSASTATAVRKAFDAAAAKAGIKDGKGATYQEAMGRSDDLIEAHGRLADLVVVRRAHDGADVGARIVAETALMGSARPVLLVPPRPTPRIGTSVAIAWNGSREAARAVAAALPFLARARIVTVISATERSAIDQKGLIEYLARHGIKAKGMKVKAGADAGKAIIAAAGRARADLLVMGAYTRSRVRELIFGGATAHALSSARLPVLMIH